MSKRQPRQRAKDADKEKERKQIKKQKLAREKEKEKQRKKEAREQERQRRLKIRQKQAEEKQREKERKAEEWTMQVDNESEQTIYIHYNPLTDKYHTGGLAPNDSMLWDTRAGTAISEKEARDRGFVRVPARRIPQFTFRYSAQVELQVGFLHGDRVVLQYREPEIFFVPKLIHFVTTEVPNRLILRVWGPFYFCSNWAPLPSGAGKKLSPQGFTEVCAVGSQAASPQKPAGPLDRKRKVPTMQTHPWYPFVWCTCNQIRADIPALDEVRASFDQVEMAEIQRQLPRL